MILYQKFNQTNDIYLIRGFKSMNDIKKRYYNIVAFRNVEPVNGRFESGLIFSKNDLKTAFYCLRECVNSGLYNSVVLRVETVYKSGVETSTPVIIYDVKTGLKYGVKNYYMNRFTNYLNGGLIC